MACLIRDGHLTLYSFKHPAFYQVGRLKGWYIRSYNIIAILL